MPAAGRAESVRKALRRVIVPGVECMVCLRCLFDAF
jgi:hypothetical protein